MTATVTAERYDAVITRIGPRRRSAVHHEPSAQGAHRREEQQQADGVGDEAREARAGTAGEETRNAVDDVLVGVDPADDQLV